MNVRVLLSLLTMLYNEERYNGVNAVDTMQMTTIYRSTERASWTTAHRTCITKFGEMFNPKTKTLREVLEVAIDLDKTWNVWIGLSNQGDSTSDWRWSDCDPLGPSTDWNIGHPGNKMCVVAEKMSGRWETIACNDEFPSFVCSNTEGNCNYETNNDKVCKEDPEEGVRRVVGNLQDPSQCQEACSREMEGGEVCWAAEWNDEESCTLIFSYDPFVCDDTLSQSFTTLFVRKCFTFEIKPDIDITTADINPPSLGCSALTNTFTTTTTTKPASTINPDVQTSRPLNTSIVLEPSSSVNYPTTTSGITELTNQEPLLPSDVTQSSADVISGTVQSTDPTALLDKPTSTYGQSPISVAQYTETLAPNSVTDAAQASSTIASLAAASSSTSVASPASSSTSVSSPELSSSTTSSSDTTSVVTAESNFNDGTTVPSSLSTELSTSGDGTTVCRCICAGDLGSMTGPLDVKQLLLNKKNLSSWRRKLDSAVDNRPSAQSLGASGVALLVLAFGFIILLDVNRLFKG